MKVRQNGRIVSVAVIVAVGVNSDGRREVLGMDIGPSEAETFWTAFLRKLARRGYNQALELLRVGQRLAGRGAHSVPELWIDALARVRDDGDMGHGTIAERKARVAGAFVVPARARRRVAGRRVLVVDDVMTTGATLGACTDALVEAGAREVHVAALARAL